MRHPSRVMIVAGLRATAVKEPPVKNILICYSWSVNNVGDIAITPGLLHRLRGAFPDAALTVVSNLGIHTPDFQRTREYLGERFPGVAVLPNPFLPGEPEELGPAALLAAEKWGGDACREFDLGTCSFERSDQMIRWALDELPSALLPALAAVHSEFLEALRRADLILYNSGTTLNFGRGEPFAAKVHELAPDRRNFWGLTLIRALPLALARHRKIPYVVNGQSFDALDYPADRFFKEVFASAARVYARDPDSLQSLKRRGIVGENAAWGPDSTFFFPYENEAWARDFLSRHKLEENRFMCFLIRTAGQGYITEARERLHLESLRAFLGLWVEKTGLPVLLCPEVRSEVAVMKEKVFDLLPAHVQEHCVCMDHFWTTDQARTVYRLSRLVTSMEMHSVILALASMTPVLHPCFPEAGIKASMLRELGIGDWLSDVDHITPYELFHAAEGIHRDHEAARGRVREAMERVQKTSDDGLALFSSLLRI